LLIPRGAELIGDYLQAQWRERLGVQITWEALAWSAYFDRLDQAPPHLFLLGWSADYPDPDSFLRVSRDSARWTGWRNETYEALVEGARQSMDQEERIRLYRRADRLLIEEAALMPLTYGRLHLLLKPWVKRFPVSSNKLCFFEDVITEPH
jgi:ABC-type oligopeptide transport system substrate-binding subunit